jgi:hypothetical protein
MKLIFSFIIFAMTIAVAGFDGGYRWILLNSKPKPYTGFWIQKGKIYPPGEVDPDPIKEADLKSFMVAVKGKEAVFWAKDKNHIFFAGEIIDKADLKTFEVLSDQIAKDKNRIYCWNFSAGNFDFDANTQADPKTFRVLSSSNNKSFSQVGLYYRDEKNIFDSSCRLVKGADLSTFEVVENRILKFDAKDKNRNYIGGEVVKNVFP